MNLYAIMRSEKGKDVTKGGQKSIEIDLTAGNVTREKIGSIFLDYHNDIKDGCEVDEWVLLWKREGVTDPEIIAQGYTN